MSDLGVGWHEVRLCEWSPRWAYLFDAEAARIRHALPTVVIEHVGSTAVPDLPAKPIIDIVVGVERGESEDVVGRLQAIGYRSHTEKDRGDRVFLWLGEGDVSRYHVNVTLVGSDTWNSLRRLRDLLRTNDQARARYAAEKRAFAVRYADNRLAYLAAKSELIAQLLADG